MGCVYSRVEKEEVVRRCKERRRLMKLLLSLRAELAAAHMAYLQSLRNTGATLKQFTDVETILLGNSPLDRVTLPPSPPPPPPLPPSPPPPPNFSPVSAKGAAVEDKCTADESSSDDESCPTPPPPVASSSWDFWDPFDVPRVTSSSPLVQNGENVLQAELQAAGEEEDWAETKSEFGEEEEEMVAAEEAEGKKDCTAVSIPAMKNIPVKGLGADNSSAASCFTKNTEMPVVLWSRKKTMAGIVKEIDECFLRAAAGGKDLAALLAPNRGHPLPWGIKTRKGKSSKSAKVVNAFSWSWSFRSPHSNRYAQDSGLAVMPGNLSATLEKLYAEEQKLYKEVKDEEIAKFQYKKITQILQKLETRNHDWTQAEKTRSDVEDLQNRLISLQESITEKCSSIIKLRDEELYPQLIKFSMELVQMWRTMYECHELQSYCSQQVNLLDNHPGADPTTDSHRHATAELEQELVAWYNSFCNLFKCQREYVQVLDQWVRLTECLPESNGSLTSTSGVCSLSQQLNRALDNLHEEAAGEAIKSFMLVIRSIVVQQTEEHNLQKRSERLESRLEKELHKYDDANAMNILHSNNSAELLRPNKHIAKLEAFRNKVDEEKTKYLNSVCMSRAMTLNNFRTSLPNIFQALMAFASACLQVFEGIAGATNESCL